MKDTIKSALELVTHNQGDGWFCIIEEPKNEKFIQFAWDESQGLWVDLPRAALNEEELARAVMMFSEYNISLETRNDESDDEVCEHEDCCEDDDCECCGHEGPIESFNSPLGTDTKKANEIAYRVLTEVYKLQNDTKLNVTISAF